MWTFILQAMLKMHLNFSGCRGLTLNGQEHQEMLLLNSLKSSTAYLWKSTTEVCHSWPPLHRQMFLKEQSQLPFYYVLFISALWFSVWTKHRHAPFSWTHLSLYILYLKHVGSILYIRTDFNEWMFMYSITYRCASLLYPSMMGTRKSRLRSTRFGDLNKNAAFKNKNTLWLSDLQY